LKLAAGSANLLLLLFVDLYREFCNFQCNFVFFADLGELDAQITLKGIVVDGNATCYNLVKFLLSSGRYQFVSKSESNQLWVA